MAVKKAERDALMIPDRFASRETKRTEDGVVVGVSLGDIRVASGEMLNKATASAV